MTETASPRRRSILLAVVAVLALVASFCTIRGDDRDGGGDPAGGVRNAGDDASVGEADPDRDRPFRIQLREGEAVAQQGDEVAVVQGTPLDPDQIEAVTARLDPLEENAEDREAFNRPAESLPPPTAGQTVQTSFPAADSGSDTTDPPPTPAADGPLEVVRVQPEGEVDVAPFLSVTFNQPMIPLATLDQLDDEDVPVVVEPALDGRWRWVGTRTVRFEVDPSDAATDRLPMATAYTVTVPAGTASATGHTLDQAFSTTFSTPAPTVRSLTPAGDSLPLVPVFVAVFDQIVDAAAVLDRLTLDADGDRDLRLATDEEIRADDLASAVTDDALDGRSVAFRPVDPLPADTQVSVTVPEGTPSAEGPLTTTSDQRFSGRTFPPLSILRAECGFGRPLGCRPGDPLILRFSNPLDGTRFDPATVTITPELPGAVVSVRGPDLIVDGPTQANTTYAVIVPPGLQDDRGQTLGEEATREFDVGDPLPFLRRFDDDMVTLDPFAEQPSVSLVSAGHEEFRVVALEVAPEDWPAYLRLDRFDQVEQPDLPVVFDEILQTGAADGAVTETIIDLSEGLPEGNGQLVLYVEPLRSFPRDSEEYWRNQPILTWVQATTLGVDVVTDQDQLLVWTTDLRDGRPVADAEITYAGQTGTSDSEGLATLDLDGSGESFLTVTANGQTAVLNARYAERWTSQPQSDQTRWHVFDDRGLYRPGETLRIKGWVRRLDLSDDARLGLFPDETVLSYQVFDAQYVEVGAGQMETRALGGFDLAVELPEGANLGFGTVAFQLTDGLGVNDGYWEHRFQIEEFRRPEFEVRVDAETSEPQLLTRPVTLSAEAVYFAGGGLSDAPVTWTVTTRDTTYTPPGWPDFQFGVVVPWWQQGTGGSVVQDVAEGPVVTDLGPGFPEEETVERLSGTTDASGRHYLDLTFGGDTPEQPVLVSANAAVEDVNRQSFGGTTDLLVHAGERYLGLRSDRAFVRQGDPLRVDAVLTGIDGEVMAGESVILTAERLTEEFVDGELTETAVDPQTCAVTTEQQPEPCAFATDVGGRYRISGSVSDTAGGINRTELEVWVSGGEEVPSRRLTQEQLTLIPAQQEYVAGDTAEVLVPAPFSPATGLVTITRNGIRSTEVVAVNGGSAIVEIPLTEDMIPGIGVQVDLVGAAPRLLDDGSTAPELPDRPAFATGSIQIGVPPISRTLTVAAEPRDPEVLPGSQTAVDVTVTDADGNPVAGADLAVAVVDEAVLSLIGYEVADPLDSFYRGPDTFLDTEYLRRTITLTRADALGAEGFDGRSQALAEEDQAAEATEEAMSEASSDEAFDGEEGVAVAAPAAGDTAAGGAASGGDVAQGPQPITVRSDFDALAVFAPSVTTDAEGRATVDVDLPDSLTRYRVIAVAAAGSDLFGSDEGSLTARLPLQVRPSAPRFANFGDRFELPVVVQNQSEDAVTAHVVLETTNLDVEQPGVQVDVPAGDRVEVRFPVTVAEAGTARFRATAVIAGAGEGADSATVELPVYTPTTAESFATYGVLDDGAIAQPLRTPQDVVPQFGGLEVTTSSTALQALTDAVLYLTEYEYASTDAYASRLLAIAALRDVLEAFEADALPSPAEIEATVARDIEALVGLQNDDGGWPVWQRRRTSEPYHTVQATHALVAARAAGYEVPPSALDRALVRLEQIEQLIDPTWSEITRQTLRAYALHVRHLAGDSDPAQARDVHRSLQDAVGEELMPLDAIAWIWPVVDDPAIDAEIERLISNQVTETPSAATFTTGYAEDAHLVLGSDRRTDGIVLDALLDRRPDSDLIVKIVNGLLANQRRGRWDNVQENAFILLAVKRYFDTFEATTPDFVARVWLGDLYAAEHIFQGRSVDSSLTVVPTGELLERADPTVVIAQQGDGRLYYRLGLRTAPADLQLDARDEGFVVQRVYEPVGDAADVALAEDGTWRIRAGAEVRVRLTLVADSRRVNMALVDPFPAGFEPVNPALAAAPALPPEPSPPRDGPTAAPVGGLVDLSFPGPWFEHQNLRDDRAEAFSGLLGAGTYGYTYIARATTPGTFVVPPAVAEEIYTPEVFGRTATDTVVVQ